MFLFLRVLASSRLTQTYFRLYHCMVSAETSDSRHYVCVRRLSCEELGGPFGRPTQDQRPFGLGCIACTVKFFPSPAQKSLGTVNPKQTNVPLLLLLGPVVSSLYWLICAFHAPHKRKGNHSIPIRRTSKFIV